MNINWYFIIILVSTLLLLFVLNDRKIDFNKIIDKSHSMLCYLE